MIQDWWEIPRRVRWLSEHGVIEYFRMIYFMPTGHGFQNDFLCMWRQFYSNVSSVRNEICVDMIMYRPAITADSMQHLVSLKAPFLTLTFAVLPGLPQHHPLVESCNLRARDIQRRRTPQRDNRSLVVKDSNGPGELKRSTDLPMHQWSSHNMMVLVLWNVVQSQ